MSSNLTYDLIEEESGRFRLYVYKNGKTVSDYIDPSNRNLILRNIEPLLKGAERALDAKINS